MNRGFLTCAPKLEDIDDAFQLVIGSGHFPPSAPMRQKSGTRESLSDRLVKNIRRVTRKKNSSEEKFRIVLVSVIR